MINSWLWPDHVIGKRESRRLREEHNEAVNLNAELLQALKDLTQEIKRSRFSFDVRKDFSLMNAHACAIKAIHQAEPEPVTNP